MPVSDAELARRATRYEVVKRALIVFTAVLVTVCFVILISLARGNHQAVATIQGCTQPGEGHDCFERSQKATAAAVGSITTSNTASVVAAAGCAVKLAPQADHMSQSQLVDRITACVVRQLAQRR
jgi:hypothetical protein